MKALEGKARTLEITREEYVRGEALPAGSINDLEVPKGVEVKVLARDRKACARCGSRLNLHLHHVVFRSMGGPNEVWNLLTVCAKDHALIHGGTLDVWMDAQGRLIWNSKADKIDRFLKDELKEFASVPSVTFVIQAAASPAQASPAPTASNGTAPRKSSPMAEEVIRAVMMATHHTKDEARERVMKALQMLSAIGRAPTKDDIFATAIYGELVVDGPLPSPPGPPEGAVIRGCGNGDCEAGAGGENGPKASEKGPEDLEKPENGDLK